VDKERYTIEGKKRTGDLPVKTRFRNKPAGFLIHIEHQARPNPDPGKRMLEYFMLDWRTFDLPVYPVALLSHKEPGQAGQVPLRVESPNRRVLQFDFDRIDLARLEAAECLKMANPAALALASRMRFDQSDRIRLTRDFFVRLAETSINRAEQELVAGFYSAYQPLDAREALQLEQEIAKVSSAMVREKTMQLTNPFIELGIQRGIQRGIQQGVRKGRQAGEAELVLRLLKRRLGALSASREKVIRRLEVLPIEALGEALLEFGSRGDLSRWLRANAR
jgi:hypothetical protein